MAGVASSATKLALFTSDPTIANTGTEVVGGSYARKNITWSAVSNGAISNSGTISFTNLPACTITHWGIYDPSGNAWYFGRFEIPIIRTAGQGLDIVAGNLAINEV